MLQPRRRALRRGHGAGARDGARAEERHHAIRRRVLGAHRAPRRAHGRAAARHAARRQDAARRARDDAPAAARRRRPRSTARSSRASFESRTRDLERRFRIARPRVLVLGLNPHAGESGTLGTRGANRSSSRSCARSRPKGSTSSGPVSADTAFTPESLARCDVVVAMYHDQGLPVLKALSFGEIVNVTLGLPIVRTSVDHGTALALAGTGRAQPEQPVRGRRARARARSEQRACGRRSGSASISCTTPPSSAGSSTRSRPLPADAWSRSAAARAR